MKEERDSQSLKPRSVDGFVVLVHGGAWNIPLSLKEPHRRGVERAHAEVSRLLASGADPLDAVVFGLVILEDDPVFDAGTGSFLNDEGQVELDAALMTGKDLKAGAVASVGCFANPSRIAREILHQGEHVLLVGLGAERFARERGFVPVDGGTLVHPRERAAYYAWVSAGKPDPRSFFRDRDEDGAAGERGTVGIVAAVPCAGGRFDLYAGTSTGGTPGKKLGRIGDTPLIGCGIYADNAGAAAVCSGYGEAFIRLAAAHTVSERVKHGGHPRDAVSDVLRELFQKTGGRGAIMAVDGLGRCGCAFTTPDFAFCGEECVRLEIS